MTNQEIISAIARDALAEVSPAELPLLPAVERAYFQRGGSVTSDRESALGFGVGTELAALAPAALALATEVCSFAATQIGEAAKKEGSALISERVRLLFKRFHSGQQTSASGLSGAQLAAVRKLAHEKARALKIPEDRATLLADAIVGSLAVPK